MPATALSRTRNILAVSPAVRVLHAWHLWSLDAPTVAVVWTALLARVARVSVPAGEYEALFLATWLLYVGDRMLDSRSAARTQQLQPRHLLHRRHRATLLVLTSVALLLLLPLVLRLPPTDLRADLGLTALLAVWFGMIHLGPCAPAYSKECVTGVAFAAAVAVPTLTRHGSCWFAAAAAFFALLCTVNGLLITAWESPNREQVSTRALQAASLLLAAAALVCALGLRAQASVLIAVALAAFGLALLDRIRATMTETTLRAAADLVLLTPLLVWPFLR